ncbi:hypothetical protein GM418_27685 [Maribellus comscasis]|uniref:Neutral/alkaline non-lysosomal ceramidase N-terminal domain-containing protein n=1 Tax=Maribellus comscasis TaxID=2681766 RepID=A0A6I6JXM9_9BACT|nr:hypothetical protein [Maribellus comscasis]QGY47311.1 hypothetical protein GM418_27685 [Maribellus comscasis]
MKKSIIIVFVLFFAAIQGQTQSFKAGTAMRDITPENLIPISGGMGTPVMPDDFRGKLTVRALVLEKGDTKVAIVGIDNIGWPAYLGDRSRKRIKDIAPENIIIGVTHTHSAPDAYGFPDGNGNTGADLDYLNWCVVQIADAVNDAAKNLQPAELKTAVAKAEGKIAYNYYAPRLYDPRMGVIQATATTGKNKGKTIATLVNYATHPEILGTKSKLISPDLCGPLYDRIESKTGGVAIYINSAQGGMVTADNRRENGEEANDWQECMRIGNLMADEALRIIQTAPVQKDPQLYCISKIIELPVDNEAMQFVFQHSPVAQLGKKKVDNFSKVSTQINLLNIGTAQVLTIPGEALPNIGFYLKRHMKTEQPFLFGLTNDAFGYILTKEDFNSFERYNYISKTSLGEMTAEILENEALKLIGESPAAGD